MPGGHITRMPIVLSVALQDNSEDLGEGSSSAYGSKNRCFLFVGLNTCKYFVSSIWPRYTTNYYRTVLEKHNCGQVPKVLMYVVYVYFFQLFYYVH